MNDELKSSTEMMELISCGTIRVEPLLEKLGIMASKELKEKFENAVMSALDSKQRIEALQKSEIFNNDDFSNTNPVLEATALTFQGHAIVERLSSCDDIFIKFPTMTNNANNILKTLKEQPTSENTAKEIVEEIVKLQNSIISDIKPIEEYWGKYLNSIKPENYVQAVRNMIDNQELAEKLLPLNTHMKNAIADYQEQFAALVQRYQEQFAPLVELYKQIAIRNNDHPNKVNDLQKAITNNQKALEKFVAVNVNNDNPEQVVEDAPTSEVSDQDLLNTVDDNINNNPDEQNTLGDSSDLNAELVE